MKNLNYLMLIIVLILAQTLFAQNDNQLKYKVINPIYYLVDTSIIDIDNDSMEFNGYMVFKSMYTNESYTRKDNNYVYFDFFFVNNLEDIPNPAKVLHNTNEFHSYLIQYEDTERFNDLEDTTKENIKIINSKEYLALKRIYNKYYFNENGKPNRKIFLNHSISTKIFDKPDVHYVSLLNCDSVGYFIFKCSFLAYVLKYKSYYISGKDDKGELIKHYPGFIKALMPISSLKYINAVDLEELIKSGFRKANWYPNYIYYNK